MRANETVGLFDRYVIGNYRRLPVVVVRGEGSLVWDADGRRYIDLFPGWAVSGLGHCHPAVVAAVRDQVARLIHIANNFYTEEQGRLAEALSRRTFGGKCFFCNSGAEANEAALKLSRLAGAAAGRYRIVSALNSFHGRTWAAVTATGQEKYHQGFAPLVPGFSYVPFGDIAALEREIGAETAAVLLEPIQGEGGVNVARPEYLRAVRELCTRTGCLLILDEVQTGMGRTGRWFAYQHYGIEPDILTMAKALGGGLPIGAIAARAEVAGFLKPGTHASTFGGNSLACAAGLAVIRAIEEEGLLDRATATGLYLMERLRAMGTGHPGLVREVRGMGLMVGMELTRPAADLAADCLDNGLLVNCTHDSVMRFVPAANVPREILDEGLEIFGKCLDRFAAGGKR
jgi:acetylornithine/N-succinyldiaminopimelate aminotransferase